MKVIVWILCLLAMPAIAQSDYYANRYNGRATEITPSNQASFNTVNGYFYDSKTNTYYKGKNINRDAGAQPNPQGSLAFTYNQNRYAPRSLSIQH